MYGNNNNSLWINKTVIPGQKMVRKKKEVHLSVAMVTVTSHGSAIGIT
jgi:hypothetical protein